MRRMNRLERFFPLIVLCFLAAAAIPARGQNLVTTDLGAQPPNVLVQTLIGAGVAFSNVTYQGTSWSSGTFTGGNGIVGFNDGIILSSGAVSGVVGPNNSPSFSTSNAIPGDIDLANLAGIPLAYSYDATVLEFDFVPTFSQLTFQYVFSSEEFNEYVNGGLNDTFGFFVNGQNYALVPGTGTYVSIDTVNDCSYPTYYIDNDGVYPTLPCSIVGPSANLNTQMDGLTVVMTVNIPVVANATNHIKLAISDMGDDNVDSNVFIRAQSFTSAPTPTNTPTVTATFTPTSTPTPFPTVVDEFKVSRNIFTPASGDVVNITVNYSRYPGTYGLLVYNSAGEFIKSIVDPKPVNQPIIDFQPWDGTNKNGEPCASGVYFFYLIEPFDRKIKKVLLVK